jgi:hypothetical protein
MANEKPQTVSIDNVEYKVEDLSDKAKMLIDHVSDLDRKMGSMRFQMDQIQVGRDAFFAMLKTELETKLEVAEEVVQ